MDNELLGESEKPWVIIFRELSELENVLKSSAVGKRRCPRHCREVRIFMFCATLLYGIKTEVQGRQMFSETLSRKWLHSVFVDIHSNPVEWLRPIWPICLWRRYWKFLLWSVKSRLTRQKARKVPTTGQHEWIFPLWKVDLKYAGC